MNTDTYPGPGSDPGSGSDADDVSAAIAGELRLLDPAVRSDRARFAGLLDPAFVEIGSSGRRYTYADMIAWLPDHAGSTEDGPVYEPSDITGAVLAPGLVQLSFETVFEGQRARRTSLWRRDPSGAWRMLHHQGTPVPPGVD